MFTTNKNWVKAISEKDVNVNDRVAEIRRRLINKRNEVTSKLTSALAVESAA